MNSTLGNVFVRLKKEFLNLKISTKLMLFYFIFLIFSVILSSILYQKIYSSIMSSKVSEVSLQTLYSINSNIESMVENSRNLSKVIITSDEVQEPLNYGNNEINNSEREYTSEDYSERDIISVDLYAQRKISSYVSKFIDAFPFISSIYIFDNGNQRYGIDNSLLKRPKYNDIRKVSWYDDAVSAKGGYILRLNAGDAFANPTDEKYISLIRIINDIYTQKPIGVLIMNISENSFVNSYKDIINKYDTDIMILDGKGQSIVNFRNPVDLDVDKLIKSSGNREFGSKVEKFANRDYLVSYLNIEKYDWKIISMMPFNELSKESRIFSIITFMVIAVNSFLLFLGSILVSRLITTPIKKLLRSMKGVEKGEFKKVDIIAGNDEIGKLRDGYNIMIQEIQNLINKVVEDQRIKRKAELDILQAQIKPHFLYNTFDAVSSLALSGKNDEAYKVMKALGSFYRTSLNKGGEVITIGQEIDVVKNYLTIQQVRYGDIFSVNYDVDENVKKFKILKLILQPLVENSLYHGIKPKGEKGRIDVTAKLTDGNVILTIADDGVGMDDDEVKKIMTLGNDEHKASFGLRGTIERLRIFYGEENTFVIESKKGQGTKITVSIPIEGSI